MKTNLKHEDAGIRHYCLWLMATLLLVVCTHTAGAQLKEWDRTLGGTGVETLHEIHQTNDGGYLVVGFSYSGATGDKSDEGSGVWVVKLDKAGNKEWDKTYASEKIGSTYEVVSVQQTNDEGYVLGGYIQSDQKADTDYWIIKLNKNGIVQWSKTFGGDNLDRLYVIKQTKDGGYIIGGGSHSGISGDKSEANRGGCYGAPYEICTGDYWVIKLDEDGNKEWDKTFGGIGSDVLQSIDQTNDGGYILGGSSNSILSGDKTEDNKGICNGYSAFNLCTTDYWIIKIDAKGNKEWDKTIGGDREDYLEVIWQTNDGGYILGGSSGSGISGDKSEPNRGPCRGEFCTTDFWIVKLSSDGQKEWDRTYGGNDTDFVRSLQVTSDGGYIIGGSSSSQLSGDKSEPNRANCVPGWCTIDYWVVKLDAYGEMQWDQTYGGSDDDGFAVLIQTNDGGYILGGYSYSGVSGDKSEPSRGQTDYWVMKLSPEDACTPPTPSITVIPTSDVYTGGDPATIYLGYGPQSVRLVASGAARYEWTPATGLSSTTVANPVFTPTAPGSYTFTVTAYNGSCSATATVTITVIDVRCGNGKVRLCHNGQELCLAPAAVANHLRQHAGDRLGGCQHGKGVPMALRVHPNPFSGQAQVEFSLANDDKYRLELYSASGKMLGIMAEGKTRSGQVVSLDLRGEKLREGMYYLRLITGDEVQTTRLVLKK